MGNRESSRLSQAASDPILGLKTYCASGLIEIVLPNAGEMRVQRRLSYHEDLSVAEN